MNDGRRERHSAAPLRVVLGMTILGAAAVLIASLLSATGDESTPRATSAPTSDTSLTFPRTATYFLAQDNLPEPEELAKYDLVVIDSEWAHRRPRSFFDEVHALNPRVKLLAYVNVVDSMSRTGSPEYWPNSYRLWQFRNSTVSTFPEQWLAQRADGTPVHEYQDRVMTNLTDEAPRVDGRLFAEYAADWVVDTVWSAGIWDGIFLDVWGDRIYTADTDSWDIDRDGKNEPDSDIYGPGGPWDRGLTIAETRIRQRLPTAILLANGVRTPRDDALDGQVLESFADKGADPEIDPLDQLRRYVESSTAAGHRDPGVQMTIDQRRSPAGSAQSFQRARFFLTATLLQNGYWAPMGKDYGETAYYDEMNGSGLGPGYLGHPLESRPTVGDYTRDVDDGTGSPADDVFRRDFEHGIALVNAGDRPRTIDLERPYRHLNGKQDPAVNNGQETTSVTIPPEDGVILLRVPG